MRCPYCDVTGHLRAVHAHLAAAHADRLMTTEKREPILMLSYELACPRCEVVIRRLVNPRGRDPRFLEEHAAEIRLVAFDQLLYHLEAAHGESVEGNAGVEGGPGCGAEQAPRQRAPCEEETR